MPTKKAAVRCENSISVCLSDSGTNLPWHVGQSGQPRPEPVARTVPPIITSANVATIVMSSRRWNQVISSHAPGRRAKSTPDGRVHAAWGDRW